MWESKIVCCAFMLCVTIGNILCWYGYEGDYKTVLVIGKCVLLLNTLIVHILTDG